MLLSGTLNNVKSGPDWIGWVAFILLVVIAIFLLTGHGSWMIAGYNTASKEKKEQYDEKKLCRIVGSGMGVIAIVALVMMLFGDVLPESSANIFVGIIVVIIITMIVLMHTIGKRK